MPTRREAEFCPRCTDSEVPVLPALCLISGRSGGAHRGRLRVERGQLTLQGCLKEPSSGVAGGVQVDVSGAEKGRQGWRPLWGEHAGAANISHKRRCIERERSRN